MGLILKAVPDDHLDKEIQVMVECMASVPINQPALQKMVINQSIEAMSLMQTQRLATLFDGITRHPPEGIAFKNRMESVGWRQAT